MNLPRPLRWFLLLAPLALRAATWSSPATGRDLTLTLLEPTPAAADHSPVPLIVYLTNLAAPRVGTEPDETIIADFRARGFLVAVLDYARHPQARMPALARDFVAFRRALQQRTLLGERGLDLAHVFVVPSGHRLARDLVYFRETSRTLALDVIYPSRPAQSVGAVLEFSCDNATRMGNASLDFCTDTLLPGAATEGFAVAMADHPVAAPYKGLDAMPECARRIKAAVRTLRAKGTEFGLNGRIVSAGFSRGSGMALMLATTGDHPEFDGFGEHAGTDSHVDGAIVMSGRFTYLDLLPHDAMIPRYNQAWGTREARGDVWRAQGALDYLSRPLGVPLFLTINISESPDALHQMAVLRRRLEQLGSPFDYHPEEEPRGHRMPLAPAVLDPLVHYLGERLRVAPPAPPASHPAP